MARDPFCRPNPATDLVSRIVRRLRPATMLGTLGRPSRLSLSGAPLPVHIAPTVVERMVEPAAKPALGAAGSSPASLLTPSDLTASSIELLAPANLASWRTPDAPPAPLAAPRASPAPANPPAPGAGPIDAPSAPRSLPFTVAQVQAALGTSSASPVSPPSLAAQGVGETPASLATDAPIQEVSLAPGPPSATPPVRRSHLEEVTRPTLAMSAPPRVRQNAPPTLPPTPTTATEPSRAPMAASDSDALASPPRRVTVPEQSSVRPPAAMMMQNATPDALAFNAELVAAAPDATPSNAPTTPVHRAAAVQSALESAPSTLVAPETVPPAASADQAIETDTTMVAPGAAPKLQRSTASERVTPAAVEILDEAVAGTAAEDVVSEAAGERPTPGSERRAPAITTSPPEAAPQDASQDAPTPAPSRPTAPAAAPERGAPGAPPNAPAIQRATRGPSTPAPTAAGPVVPPPDLGARYRAALDDFRQQRAASPTDESDEMGPTAASAATSAIETAPAPDAPANAPRATAPGRAQRRPDEPASPPAAAPLVNYQDGDTPAPQPLSLEQALFGDAVVRRTVADRTNAPPPGPLSPTATVGTAPGAPRAAPAPEPVVQVQYIQRAVEQEAANTSETEAAPAQSAAPPEVDLNRLTEQVYQRLRRRLQIEAERLGWTNRQ